MDNVFFVEIRCERTDRTFYLRYDYAADDRWVLTRGVTSLPTGQGPSLGSSNSQVDISNSRTGPQYKCPYCGNTGFVRHHRCGKLTCRDSRTDTFRCSYCNEKGVVSKDKFITGFDNATKGQGQRS